MDKAKIAKFAIKAGLGLAVSFTIGTMIKLEKSVGVKIDDLWTNKD